MGEEELHEIAGKKGGAEWWREGEEGEKAL